MFYSDSKSSISSLFSDDKSVGILDWMRLPVDVQNPILFDTIRHLANSFLTIFNES